MAKQKYVIRQISARVQKERDKEERHAGAEKASERRSVRKRLQRGDREKLYLSAHAARQTGEARQYGRSGGRH
ncbi:MAG: hypothetical protein IJ138_03460 [Clostridia bacterium]|nr:hypothetical protein [Clostridia bacterium]MBQ9720377.1 hypothetical protein [Oscillospiraceae bacterium]